MVLGTSYHITFIERRRFRRIYFFRIYRRDPFPFSPLTLSPPPPTPSISTYNRFQRLILSGRLCIYLFALFIYLSTRTDCDRRINIRSSAIDLFRRCLFTRMRGCLFSLNFALR